MRTKQHFIALITLFSLFSFAVTAENQNRELPSFSEISLRIPGTLYLEQGEPQSVRIEASESILDEIITEVKGRTLIIRFKTNNFFRRTFNAGKISVYVTVPDIDALSVGGSGSIVSHSVESRIIDLSVSGSGDITLDNLNSERVNAGLSGSGSIRIKGGRTDDISASISGSGNLRAVDFEATNVDTRISGSGNCTITANKTLKARVSGSGNVSYKGNPQIDTAVSGSGKIKNL